MAFVITNTSLPDGVRGAAYNPTIATTGGTDPIFYYLIDGEFPNGVTLDPITGLLAGYPTAVGFFTFTIKAFSSVGYVWTAKTFTIYIAVDVAGSSITTPFNINNLVPERYKQPAKSWDDVTFIHKYQDGGISLNALNSNVAQEFEWTFTGLTKTQAAVFDAHYDQARGQFFDFPYLDRDRVTFYPVGTRYKTYERDHDRNKSWVQSRKITLIRYVT